MSYTKKQRDNLDALLKCWQEATGQDEITTLKEICLWMSEVLNEELKLKKEEE